MAKRYKGTGHVFKLRNGKGSRGTDEDIERQTEVTTILQEGKR